MMTGGVATVGAVAFTPDTSSTSTTGAPRDAYLLELEQEISALFRATRVQAKVFAERFDPDLQPVGFSVLRYIVANEPIRNGGIAAALAIDKSAVSRQLTVLRDSGFIETRHDPEDGRAMLLVSTPAARTALASFRADVTGEYARIVADWETADVATFAHLLRRFNSEVSTSSPA